MKRRDFIALIGLSAWPVVARAEQQPTLGLLSSSELADWSNNPFRAGLEEGGYVEGRIVRADGVALAAPGLRARIYKLAQSSQATRTEPGPVGQLVLRSVA